MGAKRDQTTPAKPIPPESISPIPISPILGRLIGLVAAGGSAAAVAWNHHIARTHGYINLGAVLLAPIVAAIGLGCLINPKVWWAFGTRASSVAPWIRIMARILVMIGIAVAAYLALSVYHIQTPHQVIKRSV